MCRRVVPEFANGGMLLECGLDETALNAAPAAVDDAHQRESGARGLRDVLLDDGSHVSRCERMQIELGFDGDANRFVHDRTLTLR